MKTSVALFLLLTTLTLTSCKKDEMESKKYEGVWNYQTSQGCLSTFTVKAIDDNNITITFPTWCVQGATIKASVVSNQIAIPLQNIGTSSHQASGTITENSMQFNAYRYSGNGGYWIFKLTATK